MDREKFEQLVAKAIDSLPDEFRARLENIDVVVADTADTPSTVGAGEKAG